MAGIALTTTFRPPSSCLNNVYTSQGGGVYVKDVLIDASECYPSAYASLFTEAIPYSPGVCPSGYDYDSTTPYGDDATAALCCPSGFTAYADGGLGCNTQVASPTGILVDGSMTTVDQAVLAVHGVYIAFDNASDEDNPSTTTTSPSSSSTASIPAPVAYTTLVPLTSSDTSTTSSSSRRVISTLSTSPSPRSSQRTADTATVTTSTSSSPVTSTPASSNLSTGAKAGIGVGASAAGLALIAVAALLIFRRRRRRQSEEPPAYANTQPEMYAEKRGPDPASLSELSSEGRLSELMGWVPWSAAEVQPSKGPRRAELSGGG